jgi:hypothetical protein
MAHRYPLLPFDLISPLINRPTPPLVSKRTAIRVASG